MSGLLVEVRGVRAGYGGLTALFRVNFGLPEGSVVALLGPNGAGKSTLLRVIAGSLRPREGTVRVCGTDVAGRSPWEVAALGLCHVQEGGGVFQELTVRENLTLARDLAPGSSERGSLDDAFDLFPVLKQRQSQRAGSLSGGEKRMLALSRAVLTRPKVLLVDQPTHGLAPKVKGEIVKVLPKQNPELGVSIVVVEQYVDRALAVADYAWVLTKGVVVFSGQAAEVGASGVLAHAYLGGAGASGR